MRGFTGVDWTSRPTDRLVHDLLAGPGPRMLADAASAYRELARELGAVGAECSSLRTSLRDVAETPMVMRVAGTLSHVETTIADAAGLLGEYASRAEASAHVNAVARLAMPGVDAVATAAESVRRASVVLGGPLLGMAAAADTAAQVVRDGAARVMQQYESASTRDAATWPVPSGPDASPRDGRHEDGLRDASLRPGAIPGGLLPAPVMSPSTVIPARVVRPSRATVTPVVDIAPGRPVVGVYGVEGAGAVPAAAPGIAAPGGRAGAEGVRSPADSGVRATPSAGASEPARPPDSANVFAASRGAYDASTTAAPARVAPAVFGGVEEPACPSR